VSEEEEDAKSSQGNINKKKWDFTDSDDSIEELQREINTAMKLREYEKSNPHLVVSKTAIESGFHVKKLDMS
jgi:ABC-type arginine transport system ATPase subunit